MSSKVRWKGAVETLGGGGHGVKGGGWVLSPW